MAVQEQTEDRYVKKVYRQIITLALAAHLSYIVIFALLDMPSLVSYNIASVIFYFLMQLAVSRGYFRLAVTSIHIEVCVFAAASTMVAGWGVGTALYLMALTSLTYFCPFDNKNIPYLFAFAEIIVFLALKFYMNIAHPGFLAVSEKVGLWLYVYNVCACFTVILYAAFSSKVSAAVSKKKLQDENRNLSVLANYDQLTGLLSRYAFMEKLEKFHGGSMTIVLSDIDDFKLVNDTWGHACGDRVLSESADLIRRRLGSEVDVCRWGGEEFIYLFRDAPLEDVAAKVQDVCDMIAAHTFHSGEVELRITMTFGISSDLEGIPVEKLVEIADKRMYVGKSGGKNRVIWMEPFAENEDRDTGNRNADLQSAGRQGVKCRNMGN